MSSSAAFVALAFSLVASQAPLTAAFSQVRCKSNRVHSTKLYYRSLHHGPDVEPLTDVEKLGADYTKMDKDKINRYGPGDFAQYIDPHSSDFDGGDSEMGLFGDGSVGLQKIGRDVSPHIARTLTAKMSEQAATATSYADELLQSNPSMDVVRAQQLENWATQQEIALTNRYMYEQGNYISEYYEYDDSIYEDGSLFAHPAQAGEDVQGLVTLTAPLNGVAAHEIMLKNPYMGYAKFRATFVGDASNEWSVTPSDGFLKQNEETQFVLRYSPHSPGASHAYFVIETEDFAMTWKVVGSTGEYEF